MFGKAINRSPGRTSTDRPFAWKSRFTRPRLERLEDRRLLTGVPFQDFIVHSATALHETGDDFDVEIMHRAYGGQPYLGAVKKSNTDSGRTEVHIFSGATNFTTQSSFVTPLHQTDSSFDFEFFWNPPYGVKQDLYAIKKWNTVENSTQVLMYSGDSNFSSLELNFRTSLPETDDNWDFEIVDWDGGDKPDLVGIQRANTDSGKTEVYVLTGESDFVTKYRFITPLPETDATWDFECGDFGYGDKPDLYAIQKSGTVSGRTEINVLTGDSEFQSIVLSTPTALHETGDNFEFGVANWLTQSYVVDTWDDVVAFKKSATGSSSTEVHILNGQPVVAPIAEEPVDGTLAYYNDYPYQYEVEFSDAQELVATIRVDLVGDPPIGPNGEDMEMIWESGIESTWNGQYEIIDGPYRYPISVDVQWVNSDADYTVTVTSGSGGVNAEHFYTDNPSGWGFSYQGIVAAHEAGHWLGLYDEYNPMNNLRPAAWPLYDESGNMITDFWDLYDGVKGEPLDNWVALSSDADMNALMARNGEMEQRYYQALLDWLAGETGRDLSLAQAPTFTQRDPMDDFTDAPPDAVAPVAVFVGTSVAPEGIPVMFDASGSTDSDGDVLQYRWDFDTDGLWDTPWTHDPIIYHTWLDDWQGQITLQVSDGVLTDTTTSSITVTNVRPTATLVAPTEVDEGSQIVASLADPSDPSPLDTDAGFEYAFDFGNGYGAFTSMNTASYTPTDEGTVTVKAKIRDKDGGVSENTIAVVVTNSDPVHIELATSTVTENQPAGTVVGSFSTVDPGKLDTFTYQLVAGTGAIDNNAFAIIGDQLQTAASLDYESQSSYSIRVRSTDNGGLSIEEVFVITATDVAEPFVIAPDDWTTGAVSLSLVDGVLHAFETGTANDVVPPHQFSSVLEVIVDGRDIAPDTLTVDYATGDPVPNGGLTYDGGGSVGDQLVLSDGDVTSGLSSYHLSAGVGSGEIQYGRVIGYTGVEEVIDGWAPLARTFEFAGDDEDVTISDSGTPDDGWSAITSNLGFAVLFRGCDYLTVDIHAGSDNLIVSGFDHAVSGDVVLNAVDPGGNIAIIGDVLAKNFDFSAGKSLTINAAVDATHQHIGMVADQLVIDPVFARLNAQYAYVHPATVGRPISLGKETADNLSLTDNELDRISANIFGVVDLGDGSIKIDGGVSPGAITALYLDSSAGVSQSAPISVSHLVLSGGTCELTEDNDVDVLATTTVDRLRFRDVDDLQIGAFYAWSGIASTGEVRLETGGSLSIEEFVSISSLDFWATPLADNTRFKIGAGASILSNNTVSVIADEMDIAGAITARRVDLGSSTDGRLIELGSDSDGQANTLELADAELDNITADVVTVGNSSSGRISVTAQIDPVGTGTLHLVTGDDVRQYSGILVDNLAAEAVNWINLSSRYNNVERVALKSVSGSILFNDANSLIVDEVDGLVGISGRNVNVIAREGDVVIGDTSAVVDVQVASTLNISAYGTNAQLIVEAGAHVEMLGDGGFNVLNANKIRCDGTLNAPLGLVALRPSDMVKAIDLGSRTDDRSDALELSDEELNRITAKVLRIGATDAGPVLITAPITLASAIRLDLQSGSAVENVSPGSMRVADLSVLAGDAVTLDDVTNQIARLAVNTRNGTITVSSSNGVVVGEVGGVRGLETDGGEVHLVSGGSVVIENTIAPNDIDATGPVTITLQGDEAKLTVVEGANIVGADQIYVADKMDLQGTITVPGKIVTLKPWDDNEAIDLGSTTDFAAETLELSDIELDHITAGTLRVGSWDAGSVLITSTISPANLSTIHLITNGDITDSDAITSNSLVVPALALEAEFSVLLDQISAQFIAVSTTSKDGVVNIVNDGPLEVTTVDGVTGGKFNKRTCTITAKSPLTISQPIVVLDGGDIILIASNDGGDDDHLIVNAPIHTIGGDGNIELYAGTDLVIGKHSAFVAVGTGMVEVTTEGTTVIDAEATFAIESGEIHVSTTNLVLRGTSNVVLLPNEESGETEVVLDGVPIGNFTLSDGGEIAAVEEGGSLDKTPNLSVSDVSGTEGIGLPLEIAASLKTDDGSQELAVHITGIPATAYLSAGIKNSDGSWSVAQGDLNNLKMTVPDDWYGSLGINAAATDVTTGVTSSNLRTATVHVANAPPEIARISAPVAPAPVGMIVSTSADFSDSGVLDSHAATWDWGDGTSCMGTLSEGSVAGWHNYVVPGVYTVGLTVSDDDGGSAAAMYEFVVVYDPNDGFVTGGGWIISPEGAYVDDPLLTGTANFGFVSKYKKGADVPTGQTNFQFKVADLDFQSIDYQWLVIADSKAKYKGEGVVNGQGHYGFMLTADDGQYEGGTAEDTFRMKIWDIATEQVLYDNVMGAEDNQYVGSELGGGNIVVHSGSNFQATNAGAARMIGAELNDALLVPTVQQALTYWNAPQLEQVQVLTADLHGAVLGVASTSNLIWLDRDAAGYGWGGGGMDLLSVVTHELGHQLGYDHDVMAERIDVGKRYLPLDQLFGAVTPSSQFQRFVDTVFEDWEMRRTQVELPDDCGGRRLDEPTGLHGMPRVVRTEHSERQHTVLNPTDEDDNPLLEELLDELTSGLPNS